jgi:cytochrome d ubiquinol oxidase subunit I
MVSSWYLIKNREKDFAKKSILVAATFWFLASLVAWFTGDIHAKEIAKHQPMKLAVMEDLHDGWKWVGLKTGIPGVEIPKMLSFLAFNKFDAYVPWINDILEKGYTDNNWVYHKPYKERIPSWKIAIKALYDYKQAKKTWNEEEAKTQLNLYKKHQKDFGFGYFDENKDLKEQFVPNIPIMFWSFRTMVFVGSVLPIIFLLFIIYTYKWILENKKWLLKLWLFSFFLAFLWQELGWVVAELGRQPWTVQNMLPTKMSTSHTDVRTVKLTFFLFIAIFTPLIIAEFKIMLAAIRKWPKIEEK